jgi:hypothetical protein
VNALKLYVKWLRQARSKFLDDDARVARAFDAGYVLLRDASGADDADEPGEHPSATVIKAGSRTLGVGTQDAKVGLRLLRWAEWERHFRQRPAPCAAGEAISWAERIRTLYHSRSRRR